MKPSDIPWLIPSVWALISVPVPRLWTEVSKKSVIATTLRYIFDLSLNASLTRKVNAYNSYHSGLIEVIVSYSYRSGLKGIDLENYTWSYPPLDCTYPTSHGI
jgi:hypothetical protein